MPKIIKIDKYCTEIDINEHLLPNCFNLVVAPTSSGKTTMAMRMSQEGQDVAFVAPYTGITNQVNLNYPELSVEVGMKAEDNLSISGGRITSMHSIPKMLELKNIDLLVLDEVHTLLSYSFTNGMLSNFWKTVQKLITKHPHMKIMCLTGTPQFIRLLPQFDFNEIVIQAKTQTAKPGNVYVERSWTSELNKNNNYLYLYQSRKQGKQQANKYNGVFIDSASKDSVPEYFDILKGEMPANRIFTSTLLSTGISINQKVDTIYTNWMHLQDIVQMSARNRPGGHDLKVTQTIPFFLQKGMDEPLLRYCDDFELDVKLLNDWATWYSYQFHKGDMADLFTLLYQMIWTPDQELPPIY